MQEAEIHRVFLLAALQAARQGASAKDLASYLKKAAEGMRVLAAFSLKGEELVNSLQQEMGDDHANATA